MTFNIHCNYCDSETIIKNNTIRMTCMCDDDRRIINLEDFINNQYENIQGIFRIKGISC